MALNTPHTAKAPIVVTPYQHTAYALMKQVIRELCARNLELFFYGEDGKKALAELLGLIRKERHYLIRTPEQLAKYWDAIRKIEQVTDFILTLTADLQMALSDTGVSLPEWGDRLAEALGHNATGSVIDEVLLERLPQSKEAKEMYRANPWFVTINLVRLTNGVFEAPEE